jgi:hypothetical protein
VWERDERYSFFDKPKDRENIIDLDVDNILMNRIYEYDLSHAEISLIETAVNCTAAFNIHFAANC